MRVDGSTSSLKAAPGSSYRLTGEQDAIVETVPLLGPGMILLVNAYAGTGKTSTLKAVARAMAPRKGLYMPFDKETARSAKGAFPSCVTAKTQHSVAYQALSMQMHEISAINAHSVLDALGPTGWSTARIPGFHPRAQARYIARFIEVYCQGDSREPGEAEVEETLVRTIHMPTGVAAARQLQRDPGALQITARKREAVRDLLRRRGAEAVRLFMNWREHGLQISHDVYLKALSLDLDLLRHTFRHYDYLMLDEGQDSNDVVRGCIVRSGKPLVVVGDPLQQIYSWRGASDALRRLTGKRLYLSQSFRFGAAIAAAAWAVVLAKPGTPPDVPLRGSAVKDRVVQGGVEVPTRAVLCRTNAEMLRVGLRCAAAGQKVFVVKGIAEMVEEVRSAQALHDGVAQAVRADKLKRFEDWAQLVEEAEEGASSDLKRLVDAVEEGLVAQLPLLERACVGTQEQAHVILATVHGAKGREWSSVALADDFQDPAKLIEKFREAVKAQDSRAAQAVLEEYHILYVAMTRAIELLSLPDALFEAFGVRAAKLNSPEAPVSHGAGLRQAPGMARAAIPPTVPSKPPSEPGAWSRPLEQVEGGPALPPARFRQ